MARLLCCLLFAICAYAQEPTPPFPAPIPGQPQTEQATPPTYQHAFGKMMLTLVGLIVLIILTVWMLKRLAAGRHGRIGSGQAIKILERRPLSQKSMLYLLEIEGKQVLISESQLEVRALTTLNAFTTEK